MTASYSPDAKIGTENPDFPGHRLSEVHEPESRDNSFHGQPDDRIPFLRNDAESDHPGKSSRSTRCCQFSDRNRKVVVGSLSLLLVIMIVFAFMTWRLFEKESLMRGRNRKVLVHAKHGAVATELDTCSNIGVNILREGGNAVDAAIASGICIGSINMFSAGIGGYSLNTF